MTKISADHLARSAVIYVRQSSMDQVVHNLESQRRQYGLAARARELGWSDVEVIDDDLGKSGGGVARRGFERLLASICEGRVGAVFSIEASRLARNGRDWHTLLEFCGLVGTLIVDEDGVYDSRSINDRLLLGMKGAMSEMELSVIRQRSIEAVKQKARRSDAARQHYRWHGDARERVRAEAGPHRGRALIQFARRADCSAPAGACQPRSEVRLRLEDWAQGALPQGLGRQGAAGDGVLASGRREGALRRARYWQRRAAPRSCQLSRAGRGQGQR